MNKKEMLSIVNEPSKHIQIVNLDGEASIAYSAKFVELLELIPTMLTKSDMVAMLEELLVEIEKIVKEEEPIDKKWAKGLHYSGKIIKQKISELTGDHNHNGKT